MSFSKEVKKELLNEKIQDDEKGLAFLAGIIRSIGKIDINADKITLEAITDIEGLYYYCNDILKRLYGDYAELEITEKSVISKTLYYRIKFPEDKAKQILKDVGAITLTNIGYEVSKQVDEHIVKSHENIIAYIKAVFLASSTNSIKISQKSSQKSTSGYHLEFTSHSKEFLMELSELLAKESIFARLVERKKTFVLYLKDAGSISDLFALVGANNAVLTLQNEMATREVRNAVNRQVNCLSANISKTIGANAKQLEAIEAISSSVGLESLSEDLQEIALLRLANTEESLQDLVKLSGLKLTKSGINHRMRKIIKIAKELKD